MITLHRIADTSTEEYRLMEKLIVDAFPPEEYRDLVRLREYTEDRQIFYNNLILDGGVPVGIITYWDLGGFHYVEHFATLPSMRNHGYGRRVLALLTDRLRTPVVLEVEKPEDELSRRRIGFYGRCGFTLWRGEYRQPPYRPGDRFLPMCLMAYGDMTEEKDFDMVKRRIYKEVYGVGE